jgi:predicted GNAT family N-acyltransferase
MSIRMVRTNWADHQQGIRDVRDRVYIQEQQIPQEEEWDEAADQVAHYVVAQDGDRTIGCIRLFDDGHFGRLAVLPEYRSAGIGQQLVEEVKALAESMSLPLLLASAQCTAMSFYWQLGFYNDSHFYLDAGIPHLDIALPLNTSLPPEDYQYAYRIGQDNNRHTLSSACEVLGFLLTQLSQQPTSVMLALSDPENPYWHHPLLISALVKYLRQGKHRAIHLVIRHDNHITDLPLFTMARRVDSKVKVMVNSDVDQTQGVFGRESWFAEDQSQTGSEASQGARPMQLQANAADARTTWTIQQALTNSFNSGNPSKELPLRHL